MICLRAATGEVAWEQIVDGRPVKRIEAFDGGRVSLESLGGEIHIHEVAQNKELGSLVPPRVLGVTSMRMLDRKFLYASRHGYIGELDRVGTHIWQCAQPLGHITGWLALANHIAVTTEEGKLWFVALAERGR